MYRSAWWARLARLIWNVFVGLIYIKVQTRNNEFFPYKKLINLVRFAVLVNLTNLAQSSHIKACQPHQLRPGKPC